MAIKQLRNSKGHFMSVDETRKVMAKNYLAALQKLWAAQTYQSAKRYGSFEGFVRNKFVTRKGEYAVINWDAVKGAMNS